MNSSADTVSALTARYLALWSESPQTPPAGLRRFSASARAEKEREVEILLEQSIPRMERYGEMEEGDRDRYLSRAHTALGRLITGEGDPAVNRFFEECESAGKSFVRKAREFDSALSDGDIHQALRNQWVFNSIQSYLGHPVTLTSSSLGYSLMYPCTDNLLDDGDLPRQEKARFNASIGSWLRGEGRPAPDGHDGAFHALLLMIESEYPRRSYPDVYESLLAIYRAQERSLMLHGGVEGLEEGFLQSLTIEKGGTSVAADGYLVSGTLSGKALDALFGYGVVLQFIDDLQDMTEDSSSGHSTMFTRAGQAGALDDAAARLLNFTCRTIRLLDRPGIPGGSSLPGLIEGSCVFLILEAVARYRPLFSPAYIRLIEEFSPLRFTYLGGLHDRVRRALAGKERAFFAA